MFVLFNIIFSIAAGALDAALGTWGAIGGLYGLAMLIPGLAVGVRRLHDTGKSGWMLLIAFIPVIGLIWLLVLLATDSTSGSNSYGPNPKNQ